MYTIDSRPAPIDIETDEYVSRTLQNAKNLLRLQMGEVPFDRRRGIHPGILEMPISKAESVILDEVTRVLAWEPDIRVISARLVAEKPGEMYIEADVEVV